MSESSTKYFETGNANKFMLTIMNVEGKDAGTYIINCGVLYSDRTELKVIAPSTYRSKQLYIRFALL